MKNLGLPLKISFIVFAVCLVAAGLSYNFENKKMLCISLIATVISTIVMVVLHRKSM